MHISQILQISDKPQILFHKYNFLTFPQLTAHSVYKRDLYCLHRVTLEMDTEQKIHMKKLLIAFLFTLNINFTVIISSFTKQFK